MQKVTPNLWFDSEAEQAAKFYTSLLPDSKILNITHFPNVGQEITGKEPGSVMTVVFRLAGQEFVALNGGPQFKFNEAVSFIINCKDQAEIDELWEKLTAGGGEPGPCGWLKDKWGLSWQICPENMDELLETDKAFAAMLKMKKLNIEELRKASQP